MAENWSELHHKKEGSQSARPCAICAEVIPAKLPRFTLGGTEIHFMCAPEQARMMWLVAAFDRTMGRLDEFADRLERIFASSVIYVETPTAIQLPTAAPEKDEGDEFPEVRT